MNRDERLAVALRAFVALGLEAQAQQSAEGSTPAQRDEARAATDALLTAMTATGDAPAVVDSETVAAWIGMAAATFEHMAAKEVVRRSTEGDSPVERQIRDAMDAASWRSLPLAERLRIEAHDAALEVGAHLVACSICARNDARSYEGDGEPLEHCAELERLQATARQARRSYENAP